jgi:hypothetical protein
MTTKVTITVGGNEKRSVQVQERTPFDSAVEDSTIKHTLTPGETKEFMLWGDKYLVVMEIPE